MDVLRANERISFCNFRGRKKGSLKQIKKTDKNGRRRFREVLSQRRLQRVVVVVISGNRTGKGGALYAQAAASNNTP